MIFDGFGSDFGTRLLQGIESECDRRQLDLLFKCTYGSIEKEKQAIDAAIRAGVKGILLLCAQGDNLSLIHIWNKSRQGTVKGSVFYRIFCCRLAVVSWRQDLTEI